MTSSITQAIEDAKASVIAADLPEDWRGVAFATVLTSLLAGAPAVATNTAQGSKAATITTNSTVARLGISEESFRDAADYDQGAGTLKLLLPSSRVSQVKSEATMQVALLVVSARVALGLDEDEWVDSQHVRLALDEYGRYDQSNFTGHLKKFENEMSSAKKDGHLAFKLRRQGWEKAVELWQAAVGAAS